MDTSLLIALDALLTERSVTRAARRIGRGQPAMSHALGRLRDHFDDPLLVRDGRNMVLSRKALGLKEPVARAVMALSEVFEKPASTDPRAGRNFTIASADLFAARFIPELLRRLELDVPSLGLDVRSLFSRSADQILSDGVDLAFGVFEDLPSHLNQQVLFSEPYVCVVRAGHPLLSEPHTLRAYLDAPHLEISPAVGARTGDRVSRVLSRLGYERRVTARVAHFPLARRMLETSDRVLTMTRGHASVLIGAGSLQVIDTPFEIPSLRFSQIWRHRHDRDPAHVWLRETAADVCRGLSMEPVGGAASTRD